MKLAEIVSASADVAATRSRLAKVTRLADVMRRLDGAERAAGLCYLAGRPRQDTLGVGWGALRDLDVPPASVPTLDIAEVDATLDEIAAATGPGSTGRRRRLLSTLLAAATEDEQDFLTRLILRELRQGATEGLTIEALATATGIAADEVRRAVMVSGDLVAAGEVALTDGAPGLGRFRLQLMRPVQPMLARTASDVGAALDEVGAPASVETKVDGARVQVHRHDDDIRIFTRNLRDVTDRLSEVVGVVAALPHRSMILDGEVIALDDGARPFPFQVTMGRFGTTTHIDDREAVGMTPFFFDVLHLDGDDVLDLPAAARREILERLPTHLLVPRIVTSDVGEAEAFLEATLADGHEGVMVKSVDAPYAAGRRGAGWLKVKPVYTLDLVVLGVEWGSGRREGWLSNLHLGARDPAGGWVMLGKTFKGLTDAMLAFQTEKLLELETGRSGHVVHVRPELVVEVAFDGVQRSSRYPGGVALRFARVKGYRLDKSPSEADTIDTVRTIHATKSPPHR